MPVLLGMYIINTATGAHNYVFGCLCLNVKIKAAGCVRRLIRFAKLSVHYSGSITTRTGVSPTSLWSAQFNQLKIGKRLQTITAETT